MLVNYFSLINISDVAIQTVDTGLPNKYFVQGKFFDLAIKHT